MRRWRRLNAACGLAGLLLAISGCETAGAAGAGGLALGKPAADEEIWAIRCITLAGADQLKRAERYADALRKVPGLKADLVQVISDDESTAVFYGRYKRSTGPKNQDKYRPDHLPDLKLIQSLRFEGQDVWPFILASLDLLPTYKPAHPEWDLNRVDGYWSLQVGVFFNTQDFHTRRSAAEEYCRILREQGEEAYFHHGPAQSSVTIGAFPFGAIREQRKEDPRSGRLRSVLTVTDERLAELQKRFPESLQNGHKIYQITRDPNTGKVKERVPNPSFPVIMPKAQRRAEKS